MITAHLEHRSLTVSQGLKAGMHWLLPIFAVTLVLQIPVWAVSLTLQGAIIAPESAVTRVVQSFWTDILSFSVNLLISLICGAIAVGAERAVILEERSISQALLRGWRLLWAHLGDFWGIGVRLFFILLGIGLAFSCIFVLFGKLAASAVSSSLVSGISVVGIVVAGVFLTTFLAAVWTLAFREWQSQERSKLSVAVE